MFYANLAQRHPPTHILTGAVVRLNQYVSPHHLRIAYSQVGQREKGQPAKFWAQKSDYVRRAFQIKSEKRKSI